jgi:hypothetical protein
MAVILAAKRLRPKTYSVALYLVGIVALLQIAALFSIPYFRRLQVKVDTAAAPANVALPATANPTAPAADTGLPQPAPELGATVAHAEALQTVPAQSATSDMDPAARMSVPQPSARLNVPEVSDLRPTIMALNEEATRFRRASEYKMAAAALKKAEDIDPKDPITLSNFAMLLQAQGNDAEARGYWQRIIDQGADIGAAYSLAKEQLLIMDLKSAKTGQTSGAGGEAAAYSGKRLFIDRIHKNMISKTAGGQEFMLRVVIGATPTGPSVESRKVTIKLYFFERTRDDLLVPSIAKIRTAFESQTQTWKNNQPEVLMAQYALTPELAADYGREYYGYILRIYYEGKLQDERAEPQNLPLLFPASSQPN